MMYSSQAKIIVLGLMLCTSSLYMLQTSHDIHVKKVKQDVSNVVKNYLCSVGETLPSGAYCISKSDPVTGGNDYFDGILCRNLENLMGKTSVGEFGAGLGQYGRCLSRNFGYLTTKRNHYSQLYKEFFAKTLRNASLTETPQVIKSYEGYDGAANIERVTDGFVKPIDLSIKFDMGKRYDWVLSLEVGEHIPSKFEDIFIENLVRHSCKGIIISWGVPGQYGFHHINNRPNQHVAIKMAALGLKQDIIAQNNLKRGVRLEYFKNTLMVFRTQRPC